jgi:hypothetical protein
MGKQIPLNQDSYTVNHVFDLTVEGHKGMLVFEDTPNLFLMSNPEQRIAEIQK